MWVQSLGQEDLLEKEMATHFSILAWRIHGRRSPAGCGPWTQSQTRLSTHMITWAGRYSHRHFSGEDTETQQGSSLPEVTWQSHVQSRRLVWCGGRAVGHSAELPGPSTEADADTGAQKDYVGHVAQVQEHLLWRLRDCASGAATLQLFGLGVNHLTV